MFIIFNLREDSKNVPSAFNLHNLYASLEIWNLIWRALAVDIRELYAKIWFKDLKEGKKIFPPCVKA